MTPTLTRGRLAASARRLDAIADRMERVAILHGPECAIAGLVIYERARMPDAERAVNHHVQLQTREGAPLVEAFIPPFVVLPTLIVAHGRTFKLTNEAPEPPDSPAIRVYLECFSYVIPEPGHPPTSLSSELAELEDLRTFKQQVLDPTGQPSPYGTVLTWMVDKLHGEGASRNAGEIARLRDRVKAEAAPPTPSER